MRRPTWWECLDVAACREFRDEPGIRGGEPVAGGAGGAGATAEGQERWRIEPAEERHGQGTGHGITRTTMIGDRGIGADLRGRPRGDGHGVAYPIRLDSQTGEPGSTITVESRAGAW